MSQQAQPSIDTAAKAICKTCHEPLTWVIGVFTEGEGAWLDDTWDEAVCLSGTPEIERVAQGQPRPRGRRSRLHPQGRDRGRWGDRSSDWDAVPRHQPEDHDDLP